MPAACLCRHDLQDGTSHYDLFIARSEEPGGPDDRVLLTLRFRGRPDEPGIKRLGGERLADHRRLYLKHHGPVSGGRGVLTRLLEGSARVEEDSARRLVIHLAMGADKFRLIGIPDSTDPAGNRWVFEVER